MPLALTYRQKKFHIKCTVWTKCGRRRRRKGERKRLNKCARDVCVRVFFSWVMVIVNSCMKNRRERMKDWMSDKWQRIVRCLQYFIYILLCLAENRNANEWFCFYSKNGTHFIEKNPIPNTDHIGKKNDKMTKNVSKSKEKS